MIHHSLVEVLMAVESDVRARFDNGRGLGVKHYRQVLAVTESQLLARDHKEAVFTIADEGRRHAGTHNDARIFDEIDCCRVVSIMYIDVAIVDANDFKLLTLNGVRLLHTELIFHIFELVVIKIQFLALVPAKLLLLARLRLYYLL